MLLLVALTACGGDDPATRSAASPGPASAPAAVPDRPSVVLVSIDTTRADHLGAYGHRAGTTPNIDAIAASGVVFEMALAPVPITLPSHATMLTGWLPWRHGVRDNGLYRLGPEPPTLAERLREAGWDTGAVVAAAVLDRQYGLDRGFRTYDDATVRAAGELSIAERTASEVTDAALAMARELRPPFFLFVHYFDPHAAYRPPPPFAERFASQPYDGEIAYVDDQVGRLQRGLRALPAVGTPVFVITADHGEGLGEHGEETHGVFLYQSTLRVPLVVSAPGKWPAGRRIPSLASTADVTPTLLELLGLPPISPIDGRSLGPLVRGETPPDRSLALESEFGTNSYGWAPLVGLTDGRLKWIGAPRPELYDLARDPAETTNIVDQRGREAEAMARRWSEAVTADTRAEHGGDDESERLEQLRALGYVAGSRATAPAMGDRPDPKDAIASLGQVNEARRLMAERRFDDAVRRLDQALRVSPRNVSALTLTGVAHLQAGRPREAIAVLRRAADVAPSNADIPFNLGLAAVAIGDAPTALAAWRRARELAPRHADATVNLADLLIQLDRPDEARTVVADARRLGLQTPLLDFVDGRLLLQAGRRDEARQALTRALASRALPPAAAAEARRLLSE